MKRFVSIGEVMVELSPSDDKMAMGFAGDTFNTAWYARRQLGPDWQVDYLTALGVDPLSDRISQFIARSGIGTTHITRIPDRLPGLYMIHLDGGERSFSYWRNQSAARLLASDVTHLQHALSAADLIYLSGITLAILDAADRARLVTAIALARQRGAKVAFDSNLRPRLWGDKATMHGAVIEMAQLTDIALPSFDDEAAAFGDATPEATALRYRATGVPLIIVKNGPDDVTTLGPAGLHRFPTRPVAQVVDTTAAGDSFNAAFLAAHLTGQNLPTSIATAAALAARVIAVKGALTDPPH